MMMKVRCRGVRGYQYIYRGLYTKTETCLATPPRKSAQFELSRNFVHDFFYSTYETQTEMRRVQVGYFE